jgi:serine/threonine protein kinase
LSRAGDVKVIDYGLAWRKGENKGRVQGTPEYMAPEQARSKAVNESTDIYNFGATMYRLVTWRYPPNPLAQPAGVPISAATWDKLYKPVRDCTADAPIDLCELIHQCLAYQPAQRPERMTGVQAALDALVKKLVRKPGDRLEALEF